MVGAAPVPPGLPRKRDLSDGKVAGRVDTTLAPRKMKEKKGNVPEL